MSTILALAGVSKLKLKVAILVLLAIGIFGGSAIVVSAQGPSVGFPGIFHAGRFRFSGSRAYQVQKHRQLHDEEFPGLLYRGAVVLGVRFRADVRRIDGGWRP